MRRVMYIYMNVTHMYSHIYECFVFICMNATYVTRFMHPGQVKKRALPIVISRLFSQVLGSAVRRRSRLRRRGRIHCEEVHRSEQGPGQPPGLLPHHLRHRHKQRVVLDEPRLRRRLEGQPETDPDAPMSVFYGMSIACPQSTDNLHVPFVCKILNIT